MQFLQCWYLSLDTFQEELDKGHQEDLPQDTARLAFINCLYYWPAHASTGSMDMTQGSHDPIDVMGKIPFHFIHVFWCALPELNPEKGWTHKKQDLCGHAVSPSSPVALVPIGNETNMTKGLECQVTKFHKNQQPGRAFIPVNLGIPSNSPACYNMIVYKLPEIFLE